MTEEIKKEKLVIIGGGPAGLTAAIYGTRAGLDPIILMGPEPGGQITTSPEVENYPGFPDGVNGFDLMQKMIQQVENLGGRMVYELVEEVDFSRKPYRIKSSGGLYEADAVIISTGASPRKLGLENEKRLLGKGVSYCATCDGAFFKGQEVAVVGGGDTALEEANYLTNFCSKVYIIHRRDEFRATRILQERVMNNPKIEIIWDSELEDILGEDRVEALLLRNNKTEERKELPVSAVFIAIGHIPNTGLFKEYLELDAGGYIVTDKKHSTNIEGIYAAGDVQDPLYRQVITSAGAGAAAAIEASRYIDNYQG
ncbi:MAG TPA: thioredoxin-disulfide reductase [Halanaerobiaceae bacterium]|jgi:thioredoxin reductase (NADPH)|nr:thioredoxin-disulfide reductase [Bacillota bacterium]HHU92179.1 thioredoxin-disulfide reductase [Halanaerobiaceae bacterium]HOA41594.1 thioredoxin-disulfide reductase [Halanaerobiales bacterium]HPZ63735.1 thioredoxin-disulfide reductase [Halanaerobiales bacterium]HQD04965.1 thioredoxin-disulfide reductase [Halanaerobiales bacterium]